jgi:hypothetical protein
MNQEFIKWLQQQTFNICSGGWYPLNMEYDYQMYWNWNEIIEWDE